MRFGIVLLLIILSSCAVRVHDENRDPRQRLKGHIKSMTINSFIYMSNSKDTTITKVRSLILYDKKNKILKQTDYYRDGADESSFFYSGTQLDSTVMHSVNGITKLTYQYDNQRNIIDYTQIDNGKIYFKKTMLYSNHNVIQETYFRIGSKKSNSTMAYDYTNRAITVKMFDENNKPKNMYVKKYFNRQGNIVKREYIYPLEKNKSNYSEVKYDTRGNIVESTDFDTDGKINASWYYVYNFDKKGNIIMEQKYRNKKLIEKNTTDIIYW